MDGVVVVVVDVVQFGLLFVVVVHFSKSMFYRFIVCF